MELLTVLVWLGLAIVTAIAAGARRRFVIGWFVAGLLFGPFALLAVLVAGAAPANAAPMAEEREPASQAILFDTKPCPACAERVKDAAKICRFCGYDFGRRRLPSGDTLPG